MKKTIAVTLTLILTLFNFVAVPSAFADEEPQAAVELRGVIVDEANAYIAAAPLTLDDGKGNKYTVTADELGRYRFTGVKPGLYTLTVEVEGFAKFEQQVDLTKRLTTLEVNLKVGIAEQVEVKSDATGLSTEPDKNLSAITLTEKDLEALPDDPDELLNALKQMAGVDDAQVYVGGFRERGQLPPKEAIQRININMNPFSAEFSEPGFSRFEIITKPGSDVFHGMFMFSFNDEALNARDPFAISKEPFQYRRYGGGISGPIVRNRAGFFLDFFRNESDDNDIVNAIVLNPTTLLAEPFATTVLTPRHNFNFSVRTDILLTKKHTMGIQFRRSQSEAFSGGGGGFSLPERASNSESSENTFRFSLTTIATEHAVNEFRFQFSRRLNESRAVNNTVAINVLDAFNGGGSQTFTDNENRNIEFTDNLTYSYKKHTIKTGFRAEGTNLNNLNRSNFRGTFTFSSLDQYRAVLEGVPGARPTQFSINRGDPLIEFSQWEMGWFVQDDWKVSPKLTLSTGFRHDFQTHLQDKINFAPRVGVTWNPHKGGVIRAGAGVFYNRLETGITTDTIRFDGSHQQQFIIQQPNFFLSVPDDLGGASRVQPTIRVKAEDINAPYTIQGTFGYERQMTKTITGTATYSWIRGVHLLRLRNINAPLSFENNQPVLPFPGEGPILQYESTGLSTRHQLSFNVRAQINPRLSVFGGYTLASTRSNTDGQGTMPANPYDLSIEWGRAGGDSRHMFHMMTNFTLPWWEVRLTPMITASSGRPFNITTGRDNNRDNYFTDRPAFANPGDPGVIVTPFGVFNPNPRPGDEIIPRNFGQGPGFFNANLSISKTFGFGTPANRFPQVAAGGNNQQNNQAQNNQAQQGGQRGQNQGGNRGGNNRGGGGGRQGGGGGGRGSQGGGPVMVGGGGMGMMGGPGGFGGARSKYNLTFSLSINNILNHTNLGQYNGTLTSPFFGRANRTAGGFGGGGFFGGAGMRRIDASVRFNF